MRHQIVGAVLTLVGGCTTTVQITATNPLEMVQNVKVEEINREGMVERQYSLGLVPGNARNYQLEPLIINNDNNIRITTPTAFKDERTVTGNQDPLTIQVTLSPEFGISIDDQQGLDGLARAFYDSGPPVGFPPVDLDVALASMIGSLVVFLPKADALDSPDRLFKIPPGVLSPAMSSSQIRWSGFTHSDEVNVTEAASMEAGVQVPVYGSISGRVGSSQLRKYKIETSGNGIQYKPEPQTFSIMTALNDKLNDRQKDDLLDIMKAYPAAVCMYVDQFYGIRNFRMEYWDSIKVTSDLEMNANTILTATGAYNYETNSHRVTAGSNVVVNISGLFFRLKESEEVGGEKLLIVEPIPGELSNTIVAAR